MFELPPYRFIINPKSGTGNDAAVIARLRAALIDRGHHVEVSLTRSLAHGEELAHEATQKGLHVAAAGGDGTIRAVVAGLAGSEPPLLVMPTGTENLLAQEFGIDLSVRTALACIDHPHPRSLDLGTVNGRHFMAIVGIGYDAQVIGCLQRFRTGHITHGDYVWPICRTFWEHRIPHVRIHADGQLICDSPAQVLIGNTSRYAMGLPVVPGADPSDGLLKVSVYRYRRHRQLFAHALRTICHCAARSPLVSYHDVKTLRIESPDADVAVQIDGDPGPALPLDIEIEPNAVRVLTPPPPPGYQFHPPLKHYHLRRWFLS